MSLFMYILGNRGMFLYNICCKMTNILWIIVNERRLVLKNVGIRMFYD